MRISQNLAAVVADNSAIITNAETFAALVSSVKNEERVYAAFVKANNIDADKVSVVVVAAQVAIHGERYQTSKAAVAAYVAEATRAAKAAAKADESSSEQRAIAEAWLALDAVACDEFADKALSDAWKTDRKRTGNRVRNGLNSTLKALAREDGGAATKRNAKKTADERLADVAAAVRRALGDDVTATQIEEVVTATIAEIAGE